MRWVTTPGALAGADLIILPGSKSTIAGLGWLRERRLAAAIGSAARAGQPVLGVCGGYQMLGRTLRDPDGVESPVAAAPGLDLLPVETTFAGAVHRALLGWLAARAGRAPHAEWGSDRLRRARWDRLADIVGGAIDLKAVGRLVGRPL